MRNINKKNKITFTIFVTSVILIVVLIMFLLFGSEKLKALQFNVSKDNLIFTNKGNVVKINEEGVVKENWDQNYYYGKKSLGKVPVIYNKKINLLGSAFEIEQDGNVKFLKNENTFDFSKQKFIKLDDRQYLIIAPEIKTSSNIVLNDFAIIQIDKNGSAKMINNKMDFKTIDPIELSFSGSVFNTGTEKLGVLSGGEVDLTKINGTTNEFLSLNNLEKDTSSDKSKKDESNDGNQSTNKQSTEESQSQQGQGNSTGDDFEGSLSLPGLDELKKIFSKDNDPVNNIKSHVRINNAKSSLTSIGIDYFVSDISNKFSSVFLEISNEEKIENINLSKSQTTYDIFNLIPNTQYKISLGYIENGEKIIVDTRNIKTHDFSSYIKVNGITQNSINVNAKIDKNIYVDSGNIVLLANDEVISSVAFDPVNINTSAGVDINLSIPEEFRESTKYTIEFDGVIYQGQELKLEKSIIVRNPYVKNFIVKFLEKIF